MELGAAAEVVNLWGDPVLGRTRLECAIGRSKVISARLSERPISISKQFFKADMSAAMCFDAGFKIYADIG